MNIEIIHGFYENAPDFNKMTDIADIGDIGV